MSNKRSRKDLESRKNLPRVYWDLDVVRALVAEDDKKNYLKSILEKSGHDFRLFTSVLVPCQVLEEFSQSNFLNELERSFRHICEPEEALLERVSCHEIVSDRAANLLIAAKNEGWDLHLSKAVELATADWLEVKAYHTYNLDLQKFQKITLSKFRFVTPELPVGTPFFPLLDHSSDQSATPRNFNAR